MLAVDVLSVFQHWFFNTGKSMWSPAINYLKILKFWLNAVNRSQEPLSGPMNAKKHRKTEHLPKYNLS
jgi:hypothetical protein